MKKVTFLLVTLLIGGMIFTGCKKDDPTPTPVDPETELTLTLKTGENYLAEGMEVEAYEDFRLGLVCHGENLKTLQIAFKKGEETINELTQTMEDGQNHLDYDQRVSIQVAGDISMTAVLTDTKDQTVTLTVNFKVLENVPMLFAGSFSGYLYMDAVASAPGYGEMPMPTDSVMSTMKIVVSEDGETAVVTVTQPEGEPWNINATFEGETLVCEPFSETDTYGEVMTLTLTYTIKGKRVDNLLKIEGTVDGTGVVVQQGMEIPLTLVGTLTGNLDKEE